MRQPSTPRVVLTHAALAILTIATLFPVLWVVKMALDPSQGMSLSFNPLPTVVSLENFRTVLSTTTPDGNWLLYCGSYAHPIYCFQVGN